MLRASRNPSFRIPRPQRDRVDLRQLAAIAAACVSVGVALSGTLHASRHGSHSLHESAEQDMDWQEGSVSTLPAEPTVQALHALLDGQHAAHTETSISAATSPPAAAGVARAAANSSTRPTQPRELAHSDKPALQHGAVSYHCETDNRAAAKRSKCPRDRALEARVWRVLSRLTKCSDAPDGYLLRSTGRAQLRLRFAPDAATSATFSAPTIAPSLNLRAVSKCVAGELSTLRATRKVDRFELEIGFGLTGRN